MKSAVRRTHSEQDYQVLFETIVYIKNSAKLTLLGQRIATRARRAQRREHRTESTEMENRNKQ
jgi:hypothetical protein